jgi:archaemetzincin
MKFVIYFYDIQLDNEPISVRIRVLILLTFLTAACTENKPQQYQPLKGDPIIAELKSLDQSLPEPQPHDWLYSHHERGQSFEQYKSAKPVRPNKKQNIIYLQPLGTVDPWQDSVIQYTALYLENFFALKTTILAPVSDLEPVHAGRRLFEDGGQQLLSTTILNYLHTRMPEDAIVMLAITSEDLYGGPQYNFVFGQARAKHRVAVSSLFRYYNGEVDSIGYPVVLERLIKTSAHEIGHMFSCQHCINAVCLMNGSNNLEESDSRPNRLCSECHQKLQWNLQFDVVKRIEGLKLFFQEHHLQRDRDLMADELEVLKGN